MKAPLRSGPTLALLATSASLATGCVRRTITIRSPIDVDFDYYGTYDVRLEREGYEPQMTSGDAKAPWWDTVVLDLVAEVLPFDFHSRVEWHYALEPIDDDPEALAQRARELRSQVSEAEAPAEPIPPPAPADDGSRP
ncbi:MAG: hypothetical protein ACYSW1_08620 [Planctomycetota bacterium]|jgi:hypothetical protein